MSKLMGSDTIYDAFPAQLLEYADRLRAIARVVTGQLWKLWTDGQKLRVYTGIDRLSDELCDLLAVDLKIDWWEKSAPLSKKRETLKNCWYVHKRLGTAAAMETAIRDIFEDAMITEWQDYGGQPYHYKLDVTSGNSISGDRDADLRRAVAQLEIYKNVRSALDDLTQTRALRPPFTAKTVLQRTEEQILQARRTR